MRRTTTLLIAAVLAVLALAPSQASAAYDVRIGIGDQQVAMFDNPSFQALGIKRVRYFIRWDVMRRPDVLARARAYVQRAREAGASVLLHISSDDLVRRKAKLPSLSRYRTDVTRLVREFRRLGVREFGARNEANHDSQATYRSPKRAADEFKIVRRAAGSGATIVALDVLDQSGVETYIRRFYQALGSYGRFARIVGIHNYSDVNRRSTARTRRIFSAVQRHNRSAKFWLTETGGVVNFGRDFPYSPRRAASRLGFLFTTVARYRRQIQRVYVYNWTGAERGARFDAGLTNPDGSARPGLATFRTQLRRFKR
jgi:hypothetical protein